MTSGCGDEEDTCQCKRYVEGENCDQCMEGYFQVKIQIEFIHANYVLTFSAKLNRKEIVKFEDTWFSSDSIDYTLD